MKDRLAGDTGLHDQNLSSVLFSDLDTDGEDNIVNFAGGSGLCNIDSNNVTDTEFSGILDYPEHKTGILVCLESQRMIKGVKLRLI